MCENHSELLQQIFENINMWLHFAEAKNAAIIAFNIALLAALISSNLFNITPELEHRKSGYVERKRRPYQGNVVRIA